MIKDHRIVCLKILPYMVILSICFYVVYRLNNIETVKKNIDCDFFWSWEILYESKWVVIYYGTHLTDVIRTTWDDIGVYTTKTGSIYKTSCEIVNPTYSEQVDQFLCDAKWEC